MHEVRWGIVGTGRMAATIAAELQAAHGLGMRLVAVASRDADRGRLFAARHTVPGQPSPRAWTGVEALAQDELDAVYVATPHVRHAADALACLAGGKAVLCEKPFTLNAAEAERVAAAARAGGRFLMEALWTRFLPAIAALRERLAGGALGRVRTIVGGGAFVPELPPGHYLRDPALGGGALLDAGVYLVSLASMLLGMPIRVRAGGLLGASGVDEQVAIVLSHADGAQALLYVSLQARRSPDLEILCERGRIRVWAPVFRPTRLSVWPADGGEQVLEFPVEGSGYGAQLAEVCAALRAGRTESAIMPVAESVSIMRTLDAVRAELGLRYPAEAN